MADKWEEMATLAARFCWMMGWQQVDSLQRAIIRIKGGSDDLQE